MTPFAAVRKHQATASMAARGFLCESPLFAMDFVLRLVRVMVLLAVWRVVLAGRGVVGGMTMADVLTYTLIAEAFAEPLDCRTGLEWAFWDGSIVTRMLRPVGVFGEFAAEAVGKWALRFCLFSAPLLACAPLLGVSPLPASPLAGLLFALSMVLAVSVGLAIEFIFCAIAVGLDLEPYAVNSVRGAVSWLLSGAFLPLALFPWGVGAAFAWLPFASMASAPLSIYTGTGDPVRLLALQIAWVAVLWPIAVWLWRTFRERMVPHGG